MAEARADLKGDEKSAKQEEQKVTPDKIFESLPQEMKEKIRRRSEPINVLVMGQTGAGKSTLINALLEKVVAKAHHGAKSVTAEMEIHSGTFLGVNVRVYDTVGFSDTEGRSDLSIIEEMAKANRFDLILICVRMDSRVDKKGVQMMFTELSAMMHPEAWKRTVVVLTFANFFLQQINIPPLPPEEEKEELTKAIHEFEDLISKALSKAALEVFSGVPFRIAGLPHNRELPTTNDWLYDLWGTCLEHCSDEARPLFTAYSIFIVAVVTGATAAVGSIGGLVGAGVGGGIGAIIGSFAVPVAGTALGAVIGASIGAVVTGTVGGVVGGITSGVVAKKAIKKSSLKIQSTKKTN